MSPAENDILINESDSDFILKSADIIVRDAFNKRIQLSSGGEIQVFDESGNLVFILQGDGANIRLGGGNRNNKGDGDILLFPPNKDITSATPTIHLDAEDSSVVMYSPHNNRPMLRLNGGGSIELANSLNFSRGVVISGNGTVDIAGLTPEIRVHQRNSDTSDNHNKNTATFRILGNGFLIGHNPVNRKISAQLDTRTADLHLGGSGGDNGDGEICLYSKDTLLDNEPNKLEAKIHLNGKTGNIRVSGIRFQDGSFLSSSPPTTANIHAGSGIKITDLGSEGKRISVSAPFIAAHSGVSDLAQRISNLEGLVKALIENLSNPFDGFPPTPPPTFPPTPPPTFPPPPSPFP